MSSEVWIPVFLNSFRGQMSMDGTWPPMDNGLTYIDGRSASQNVPHILEANVDPELRVSWKRCIRDLDSIASKQISDGFRMTVRVTFAIIFLLVSFIFLVYFSTDEGQAAASEMGVSKHLYLNGFPWFVPVAATVLWVPSHVTWHFASKATMTAQQRLLEAKATAVNCTNGVFNVQAFIEIRPVPQDVLGGRLRRGRDFLARGFKLRIASGQPNTEANSAPDDEGTSASTSMVTVRPSRGLGLLDAGGVAVDRTVGVPVRASPLSLFPGGKKAAQVASVEVEMQNTRRVARYPLDGVKHTVANDDDVEDVGHNDEAPLLR